METGSVIVLFLSALIGGSLSFFFKDKKHFNLKLILSFGAAYLLGLCCLHLFPILFESDVKNPGVYILCGFVLQIILEFLSHGIEHGHVHSNESTSSNKFPLLLMISLGIHSLIEGMPFGEHGHHHHHNSLLLGIVIHKVPVAFVLGSLFLSAGLSWKKSLFWLAVFAIMSPLGAGIHSLISENYGDTLINLIPKVIGILIGILMHVATTIIFESSDSHKFNLSKLAIILVGILTAWFLL